MITTEAVPCWAALLPDGQYSGLEAINEAHYRTQAEAEKAIAQIVETYGDRSDPHRHNLTIAEAVRTLRPVQLDAPCLTLTCDACETVDDVEGEGFTVHYATEADIQRAMGDTTDDWTTDGTRHHCPCDECPALTREATP